MVISRSSAASVSFAVSARASVKLVPGAQRASIKSERLRRRLAIGAQHDLVDARLGLAQLGFAMPLQQRAALVGGKRVIELGVAGLQPLDDFFEFLQSVFEAELGDFGRGFRGLSHMATLYWPGRAPASIREASGRHQRRDMGFGRSRKRVEIVAAFERRDHAAFGMTSRDFQNSLGYPGEIRFL